MTAYADSSNTDANMRNADVTHARPTIRIGVTGTDTGVGKTVVTCAIISALRRAGLRATGIKPIETGGSEDAERIRAASGHTANPLNLTGPIVLPEPLSPHIAARRANIEIDLALLDSTFQALERASDAIVVEGAGGLLVPFTVTETLASLCQRWSLDLIIVAANRLGVINHTRLTVEAARARGLNIRAIVLNSVTSTRPEAVAERTNLAVLKELFADIPVIEFPHDSSAAPASTVSIHTSSTGAVSTDAGSDNAGPVNTASTNAAPVSSSLTDATQPNTNSKLAQASNALLEALGITAAPPPSAPAADPSPESQSRPSPTATS